MKRFLLIVLIVSVSLSFTSCFSFFESGTSPSDVTVPTEMENTLTLDGRRYTYTGDGDDIQIEDDVLTIRQAGTYRISGSLKEGALRVDAGHSAIVRLILSGVSVSSSYHAPLRVESAACVILELAAGTVNTLTDADRTREEKGVLPVSCVEAYSNVVICGEGALAISGRDTYALSSMGTVRVQSGRLTLAAPHTALWARDRILLENGSVTVSAARYGLAADDSANSLGLVEITGGRLTATCSEVAIVAGRSITVSAGIGSIQAPTVYRCERQENGQTVHGSVQITSPDFPFARS